MKNLQFKYLLTVKSFCSYLLLALALSSFSVSAQRTFDEGWDDGFEAVMLDYDKLTYIIPISPIVMASEANTYRAGFRKGYNEGLKDFNVSNSESSWRGAYFDLGENHNNRESNLSFDDGWDVGYADAMNDSDEVIYIIPISPIVASSQDNYRSGYRKGHRRGLKDLEE